MRRTDGEDCIQVVDGMGGLTKREYFAAVALQGICVAFQPCIENANLGREAMNKAEAAVRVADALIEALNREKS